MARPQHNNPCPGGHGICKFGLPFLSHHYYILSLSEPCPGVEKNIFTEIYINFTHFIPLGWVLWNIQFLVVLPYRCLIKNVHVVKISPLDS